jgi:DNA polymerase III delta prime subunit
MSIQAQSDDMPHLMLYGPSGAGKKTRLMALLREIDGPGTEKVVVPMLSICLIFFVRFSFDLSIGCLR